MWDEWLKIIPFPHIFAWTIPYNGRPFHTFKKFASLISSLSVYDSMRHRWINLQPMSVLTVHVQHEFNSDANTYLNGSISVGFQYVLLEFFSYLMSHLCCMATTFPTDGLATRKVFFPYLYTFKMGEYRDGGKSCLWRSIVSRLISQEANLLEEVEDSPDFLSGPA